MAEPGSEYANDLMRVMTGGDGEGRAASRARAAARARSLSNARRVADMVRRQRERRMASEIVEAARTTGDAEAVRDARELRRAVFSGRGPRLRREATRVETGPRRVWVEPYRRDDGTMVNGHWRVIANGVRTDVRTVPEARLRHVASARAAANPPLTLTGRETGREVGNETGRESRTRPPTLLPALGTVAGIELAGLTGSLTGPLTVPPPEPVRGGLMPQSETERRELGIEPLTPGQETLLALTGITAAHRASRHFDIMRTTGEAMEGVWGAANALLAAAPALGRPLAAGARFVGSRILAPIGSAIARPFVAVPSTVAGITLATTAETQTPDPVARARAAAAELASERQSLEARRRTLEADLTLFNIENLPARGPERESAVRRIQDTLTLRGHDSHETDGKLGPLTRAALRRHRETTDTALHDIRRQLTASGTGSLSAREAIARRALAVAEGAERLRRIENDADPLSRWWRDYGAWVGAGTGFGAGLLTRRIVVGRGNAANVALADDANALLARAAGAEPRARAAAVNDFWRMGGAGVTERRRLLRRPDVSENVPFVMTPWASRGFEVNLGRVAPPSALFQPGPRNWRTWDVLVAGGLGIGEGMGAEVRVHFANAELAAAREAVRAEPNNEAAIRRLQSALNSVATWTSLARLGQVAGLTHMAHAPLHPYSTRRPNVARAEEEAMSLNALLAADAAPGRSRRSGAGRSAVRGPYRVRRRQ